MSARRTITLEVYQELASLFKFLNSDQANLVDGNQPYLPGSVSNDLNLPQLVEMNTKFLAILTHAGFDAGRITLAVDRTNREGPQDWQVIFNEPANAQQHAEQFKAITGKCLELLENEYQVAIPHTRLLPEGRTVRALEIGEHLQRKAVSGQHMVDGILSSDLCMSKTVDELTKLANGRYEPKAITSDEHGDSVEVELHIAKNDDGIHYRTEHADYFAQNICYAINTLVEKGVLTEEFADARVSIPAQPDNPNVANHTVTIEFPNAERPDRVQHMFKENFTALRVAVDDAIAISPQALAC